LEIDSVIFLHTELAGAMIVELETQVDQRGFFARSWCAREFEAQGLNPKIVQCSVSYNEKRGTLRGMHYQAEPHPEAKLVRCTRGAIHDVIIDLRPDSETYTRWLGVDLTESNHRMLYVPEGFAHGFQTLSDGTEVFYQMSAFYEPDCARGVRWNDPHFAIQWPLTDPIISPRDQKFPDFEQGKFY